MKVLLTFCTLIIFRLVVRILGSGARIAPHPNPLPEGARGPIVRGVEYCAGFLPLPPGGGGGGGGGSARTVLHSILQNR
ncbi:hypothetical protein AWP83_25035 [Escherichia coli]|nr:hypothetical protein AWP83_25035 [Escherichia coli]OKX10146.1 hypothetical protein AWP89_07975 [Escherichia coli]